MICFAFLKKNIIIFADYYCLTNKLKLFMKKFLLFAALIVFAVGVSAQKFKPVPDFLKGQTEINVVFDYSKVIYDKDSQQKYYKGKKKTWIEEWEGKRREANAEGFIKDFNKELEKLNVVIGDFPEAQYTIIVDVLNCDFGAYAGPMSVPAKLQGSVRIVKTGTNATLAETASIKVVQNRYTTIATPVDFDRMYLAFNELGEKFGSAIAKILKK